jgi:hypothetical protein
VYKVNAASIPRSQRILLRANCDAADAVGDFVYVTGPSVSGRYQVTRVNVGDAAKMPAVGIIVRKQTSTRCTVQTHGLLPVSWLVLIPQARYYVGAGSTLSTTPPAAPLLRQLAGTAIDASHLLLELVGLLAPTDLSVRIYNETPAGPINGTNVVFTTSIDFQAGSEAAMHNGVRQREGGANDYIRGAATLTFTLAPRVGDVLLVDYDPA